jgi:hypothetical protein
VVKFSEATGEMTVTVSHQDKVLGRWRTHWSPKGFPMLSQWVNPQKPTDKQKGFSHIFLIKFHLWALNHGFFLAQPSTARCVPSCIVRCTADHRWSWRWGTFPLLLSVLMTIAVCFDEDLYLGKVILIRGIITIKNRTLQVNELS